MNPDRRVRSFAFGALAATAAVFGVAACAPNPGDCPSPDDCACPCSNVLAEVCDESGLAYQNLCMLECDGKTQGECGDTANPNDRPQSVECDMQCGGLPSAPVCGAVGQGAERIYRYFSNECYLTCSGANKAPDQKCG